MMRRSMLGASTALALFAFAFAASPDSVRAQVTPAPATPPVLTQPLEIGAVAPDFELPGATRYGVLSKPVRLSDYKGEIVVLAFFFKARTKG